MVSFPEQDPNQSPQLPETSLQQKWKGEHTRELTARRTWKSTQMALEAICGRFKTFLMREYGNDYVTTMMKEYGDVDINNAKDSRYITAINTLQGPNGLPTINPPIEPADDATTAEITTYNTARDAYMAEVDHRKTYLGMPVPDAQTATRILTMIRKMREYKDTYIKASDDAVEHATRSIVAGEFPPAPMLRAVAKKAEIYDKAAKKVVNRPINWTKYGVANDDPRQWNAKTAGYQPIYTTWYMPHLRASVTLEYAAWVKNRAIEAAGGQAIGPFSSWTSVFLAFCEKNFNLKANGNGLYASPYPNSMVYIGPMLLYAAKSYGRTADPLLYWSTQSKYRLNAIDYGSKGVHVELCLVEAKIGAPTAASILVASYPAGTTKGQAIANTRPYYPHVMDVETGNNPQLDSLVASATSPTHIKEASTEFMKQPQSSRDGYRYVAVTRTVLAFPGSVLYERPKMAGLTSVSQFALLYRKDSQLQGNPRLSQHMVGWGENTVGFNDEKLREKPWIWSNYITNPTMKEMVLGVPNKHPDARMITTLDIVLVPSHFEDGILAVEQSMRQNAEAVSRGDGAGNTDIKNWNLSSGALIALTSGHWAAEKNWRRSSTKLHGGYHPNELFGAMGIPSRINLSGVMSVLKQHNLTDLSGLKTVYSGAVNDKDDIVRIITNFKESFPGVTELIMPDTKNISDMADSLRPFHTNVTSLSVSPCVTIPRVANDEWGSYIVRRIPIATTGVSGNRYTFGGMSINTSMLEYTTNDFSMEMPQSSIGGANFPIVVGGLAVAGLLAYAGYGSITSSNDSTKS